MIGIVFKAIALKINRELSFFAGPRGASSWTSARQTLHLLISVVLRLSGQG